MLGSGWLAPRLCGEGSLPELVRDVAERSGLATGLLIRNAHHAESILSVPPAHSRLPRLPSRCRQDLVAPGPARALLSRCSEAELRQLLHRRNAEAGASGQVVLKVQDLFPCIAMLRRQGWLAAVDFAAPDLLQLAVPLHGAWASETLALVVALEASSRPGDVAEVARLVLERRAVRIPAALAPPFARHLGLQSWHTNERYQAEG
jgi:DNA-binding IclR family transcriptional regulator